MTTTRDQPLVLTTGRGDDEQARVSDLTRQELEQQKRRLVRPVQVVEHDDERLIAGGYP